LVTVVTAPVAVFVGPDKALVAVVPAPCTGPAGGGVAPPPLPLAVPAAPLTAEPTAELAFETVWAAVFVAFEITF
jgi:hypothetical protein